MIVLIILTLIDGHNKVIARISLLLYLLGRFQ